MTHSELVERAVRWLRNSRGCEVVESGFCASCSCEIVDAIGWQRKGESIVIECKTCLSDLYADRYKPHMRSGISLGRWRYYLVPKGLCSADEIPGEHGLLWCYPRQIRTVKPAEGRGHDVESLMRECTAIWTVARRARQKIEAEG